MAPIQSSENHSPSAHTKVIIFHHLGLLPCHAGYGGYVQSSFPPCLRAFTCPCLLVGLMPPDRKFLDFFLTSPLSLSETHNMLETFNSQGQKSVWKAICELDLGPPNSHSFSIKHMNTGEHLWQVRFTLICSWHVVLTRYKPEILSVLPRPFPSILSPGECFYQIWRNSLRVNGMDNLKTS